MLQRDQLGMGQLGDMDTRVCIHHFESRKRLSKIVSQSGENCVIVSGVILLQHKQPLQL